jgi:hypothetical protein
MLTFDEFHAVRTRQRQSAVEAEADRKSNGDSNSAAAATKRPAQRSAARNAHDNDHRELNVSNASCSYVYLQQSQQHIVQPVWI